MIFVLLLLKNKSREQPNMKIYGLAMKTIFTIIYFGIALGTLLVIATLAGWTK